MAAREVGIGIAGYGMMGKAHSYAYTVAPVMRSLQVRPRLRVISGRHDKKVARAAEAYGFESWTTDWEDLIQRPDVDVVDICTPPGTHAEIASAAAAATLDAVRTAGVLNAVGFNYRRLPAVSLMKRMVDEGAVGKVRLFRAIC